MGFIWPFSGSSHEVGFNHLEHASHVDKFSNSLLQRAKNVIFVHFTSRTLSFLLYSVCDVYGPMVSVKQLRYQNNFCNHYWFFLLFIDVISNGKKWEIFLKKIEFANLWALALILVRISLWNEPLQLKVSSFDTLWVDIKLYRNFFNCFFQKHLSKLGLSLMRVIHIINVIASILKKKNSWN